MADEQFDLPSYVAECHIQPGSVRPEVMKSIWESRQAEVAVLEQRAQELGVELKACLDSADGARAMELADELLTVERDWKDARLTMHEAQDDYYESHLRAEEIRVLGSKRRSSIKEVSILMLIVMVLGLMVYEELVPISKEMTWTFFWIDTACCVIFLANFMFGHSLALSKRWYWKTHWIDFVTSIPFPPFFGSADVVRSGRAVRLIRLVRLARLARFLRLIRIVFFFWRGLDQLTSVLDVRLMKRSLILCLVVVLLGAFAIHQLEGNADPVSTGWESVWWSFTTTVTGGFGDLHNPETASGRFLTVMLIIVGMILIGVFTATLTTILMPDPVDNYDHERHETFQEEVENALLAQQKTQEELLEELKRLRAKLDDQTPD